MRKDVRIFLRLASSGVVFVSYLSLTATDQYGIGLVLIPALAIVLMPLGEHLDLRFRAYRRASTAFTIMFCVLLPVILALSTLLNAVTYLVMYIQLHTLVHTKSERNYDHILLMSFFLVIAACASSPTPTIGLAIVFFVVFAVWFLVLLEMHASAQRNNEGQAVDVVDFGAVEASVEVKGRRLFDLRFSALIAVFSVAVIAFSGLIFFFSPRLEAGLFGAGGGPSFSTGLSSEVDLSDVGLIARDATAVMRVVFPELPGHRFLGDMFWRSTSLDSYDGTTWKRYGTHERSFRTDSDKFHRYANSNHWGSGPSVDRRGFGGGELVQQEIFMAQINEGGMPALSLVKRVEITEGQKGVRIRWDEKSDFTVSMQPRSEPSIHYLAWSEYRVPDADELRASSEDYRSILPRDDYRNLTNENLLEKTRELVARITEDAPTVYDKAVAVERYLSASGGYTYTLDVPALPSDHPVDAFIHDTKSGHCELYASAMALMLRSLGIPTRVVNGYRGGLWNESDSSYTITADMAHLWVEVHFPDYGWVTFDPSPPATDRDTIVFGALRRISTSLLKAKMLWYRRVVGFTPETRIEVFKDLSLSFLSVEMPDKDSGVTTTQWLVAVVQRNFLVVAGAGLILYVVITLPRRIRARQAPGQAFSLDQKRAIRLHRLLSSRLRRLGVECAGKTVEELRLELDGGPFAQAVPILSSYNAVRFGRRPLSPEIVTLMRKYIRTLKA